MRSTKPSSRAYFDLYAMRFFPDYQNGSAFLERTLERAQPSLGYYPLAALLANTRNNLVITTNFDSLVEDALFIYTDKRPIVISHELLAQYINFNTSRPIIASSTGACSLTPSTGPSRSTACRSSGRISCGRPSSVIPPW